MRFLPSLPSAIAALSRRERLRAWTRICLGNGVPFYLGALVLVAIAASSVTVDLVYSFYTGAGGTVGVHPFRAVVVPLFALAFVAAGYLVFLRPFLVGAIAKTLGTDEAENVMTLRRFILSALYPEAFDQLSIREQAAVRINAPRFTPFGAVHWWWVPSNLLVAVCAPASYAFYRYATKTHHIFLPMALIIAFWSVWWYSLFFWFVYRPLWRKGVEAAMAYLKREPV